MKIFSVLLANLCLLGLLQSCKMEHPQGTFGSDIEQVKNYLQPQILQSEDAMVAVLGEYQGRVLTSSSKGLAGRSYGWFNRSMLTPETTAEAYFNMAGECRLWFGPESGKFSLFYDPGVEQNHENIRLPSDLGKVYFTLTQKTDTSVTYSGRLQFTNYSGQLFTLDVERRIRIFSTYELKKYLTIAFPKEVSCVGYKVYTQITNRGETDWSRETGLLSIWDISTFPPSEKTTVVLPIKPGSHPEQLYFTQPGSNRFRVEDSVIYYKGDGNFLNKLGVLSEGAKNTIGSYALETGVLTVVRYQLGGDTLYVNSQWGEQENPYKGEAVNVFNDGKMGEVGPFGPFYELETSSSARELKVGESHWHEHAVFHFEGDPENLDKLSKRLLGVKLGQIIGAL